MLQHLLIQLACNSTTATDVTDAYLHIYCAPQEMLECLRGGLSSPPCFFDNFKCIFSRHVETASNPLRDKGKSSTLDIVHNQMFLALLLHEAKPTCPW